MYIDFTPILRDKVVVSSRGGSDIVRHVIGSGFKMCTLLHNIAKTMNS